LEDASFVEREEAKVAVEPLGDNPSSCLIRVTLCPSNSGLPILFQKKAEKNVTAQEASDGLFSGGTNNPSLLP
jgi:hypothetical protein